MVTVDWMAPLALVLGVVAMVVTVRRQPVVRESREDMQAEIDQLRRDVAALQRMLTEKQRELDELREEIRQWKDGGGPAACKQTLVLGVGTDPMLEADLAALRGIRQLHLTVLHDVSRRSLENVLKRHRANGQAIRYLHLAVHAGVDGVVFADGIADGLWLSKTLKGLDVLVIAGCTSSEIGDLLTVAPHVVTMLDEIGNRDAAIFTHAFWSEIARDATADEALDEALRRSPSEVCEMVQAHWR